MAIDSGVAGAMAALVGASVFSTGFLSTRVHQALAAATLRAQEIDDKLLEKQTDALAPETIEQEHKQLREALEDQLPGLVLLANGAIALGVVALAIVGAFAADVGLDDGPELATLIALVGVELVVVLVGFLDYRGARRRLKERIDRTRFAKLVDAERRLATAALAPRSSARSKELDEVESIADELLARTGRRWSAALGLRVMLGLARRYNGELKSYVATVEEVDRPHESDDVRRMQEEAARNILANEHLRADLEAEQELARDLAALTKQDPQRSRWWHARCALAEAQRHWTDAGACWVRLQQDTMIDTRFREAKDEPHQLLLTARPEEGTLLGALEHLKLEGRLASREAEYAVSLLIARGVPDAEVLPWIERVALELADEDTWEWDPAGRFLAACATLAESSPGLAAAIRGLAEDREPE